jgi:vacuolar-type H+-ATPase subunit I/STV1
MKMKKILRTDNIISILKEIRELETIKMSKELRIKFMNILERELKEKILSLNTMKEDLEKLITLEDLKEINSHLKLNDTGHNVIDRENHLIGSTIVKIIKEKENELKFNNRNKSLDIFSPGM